MEIIQDEVTTIEDDIDNLISISDEKREQIESIIAKAKMNKVLSLQITDYNLDKLK
jgi:hypothetical protein